MRLFDGFADVGGATVIWNDNRMFGAGMVIERDF